MTLARANDEPKSPGENDDVTIAAGAVVVALIAALDDPECATAVARKLEPFIRVGRAESAADEAESAAEQAKIAAGQAKDDRELRKQIAYTIFNAVKVQVGIADVVFIIYGFWNGWDIPGGTMNVWLGAVVVQVIAVALVIARSLSRRGAAARCEALLSGSAVEAVDGNSPQSPISANASELPRRANTAADGSSRK